jgi:Tfp pilus assembly protein PilO
MRSKKLPKSTAIALIVGGDLVLLLLGWFMLVSPQRATARSTATAVQAAEVQIEQARAPVVTPSAVTQPKQPEIRTAYLYKLSKAMPTTTDMPNLLLELTQVVRSAGVQLLQISPTPTDPTTGATSITLSVSGDFYSVTDLLYRLRSLVAVHNGVLDVSGRLFSITSVSLTPSVPGGRSTRASCSAPTPSALPQLRQPPLRRPSLRTQAAPRRAQPLQRRQLRRLTPPLGISR